MIAPTPERRPTLPWVLVLVACLGCAESPLGPDTTEPDGGGNPAGSVCAGTAVACAQRDAAECASGAGCTPGGLCEEAPRTCDASTPEACAAVPGCAWYGVVGACGLVFLDCTPFLDEASCEAEPGCVFAPRCEGTALDCHQFSVGQCEDQPGCEVSRVALAQPEPFRTSF